MEFEFDYHKSEKNRRERQLDFEEAANFEWDTAFVIQDTRKDYSEKRYIAMGFLHERLHIICFTPIKNGIRIISFRKANKREVKRYEEIINK